MLFITIPSNELFDEQNNEFITTPETTICLEHSLVSISKWESKYNKPFLSDEPKSISETLDYIRCMTITQNVNKTVYNSLTNDNIGKINEYIQAPMTATTFYDYRKPVGAKKEIITSELIYYWMITLNIPMECQRWHLNRLLTLIRIFNVKNDADKMSKGEIMRRNAALNAARRKKLHTRG